MKNGINKGVLINLENIEFINAEKYDIDSNPRLELCIGFRSGLEKRIVYSIYEERGIKKDIDKIKNWCL